MNNDWRGKQYLVAILAAGWGMVAVAAENGPFLCQTGMVLVVPQGEPGVMVDQFVTRKNVQPTVATRATVK